MDVQQYVVDHLLHECAYPMTKCSSPVCTAAVFLYGSQSKRGAVQSSQCGRGRASHIRAGRACSVSVT